MSTHLLPRVQRRTLGAALAAALIVAAALTVTLTSNSNHRGIATAAVADVNADTGSDSISTGDVCANSATYQLPLSMSVSAQVCIGGSGGSTINPIPRVGISDGPPGPVDNGFQATCTLDIQLIDAGGNVVSDQTTRCLDGSYDGAPYAYDGLGVGNAPGTGTFTAHATLTYEATTVDLGTSPAFTAGLHRCDGPGTKGVAQGGDPATFTFHAGQEVVVEVDSTDPFGTWVSAAMGIDVNSGPEGSSGVSTIARPFYARFGQLGTDPIDWTISIGSSLGADIPTDKGPVGSGGLGGAGTVAWFVHSDFC